LLPLDSVFRTEGGVLGREWEEVRKEQIGFLLERPLLLKVQTEKQNGPDRLFCLWTDEWKEVEKGGGVEELADMAILLMTMDSINPNLLRASQISLLGTMQTDIMKGLAIKGEVAEEMLIGAVNKKIDVNRRRNPPEAFLLVANEDMETAKKRMGNNWQMLKKFREKMTSKADWWKPFLYVDEGGWVRARET
jgi:hypothetical protein